MGGFADLTEQDRADLQKRLDEIRTRPHPGRLARKLRKRQGLSVEEVASQVGVDGDEVAFAEKTGCIAWVSERASTAHELGEVDEDRSAELFDRYVALLKPNAEEAAVLRHDVRQDIDWMRDTVKALVPPELWEELANRPTPDPWETDKAPKRKSRARTKRPSLSPLNGVGALPGGTATTGQAATVDGTSAVADSLPQPDEVQDGARSRDESVVTVKVRVVTVVNGREAEAVDLAVLPKAYDRMEAIGLTLAESKQLLKDLQQHVIRRQVEAYVESRALCEDCGRRRGSKGAHQIRFRTLLGKVRLRSPRLRRCRCRTDGVLSFSPLAELLSERTSPELRMMEAKWSALVSYGLATRALQDLLPVDERLDASTVRKHTLKVAKRCEKELDEQEPTLCREHGEQSADETHEREPITVGADGGYLRLWHERGRSFEAVVGKSVPADGPPQCFGAVQKHDPNPQLRLMRVLISQGTRRGDRVRFLSDGEPTMRDLHLRMGPHLDHVLDWFHITKRFTVLKQYIKGVVRIEKDAGKYDRLSPGYDIQKKLDSAKWKLWHGKVDDALDRIDSLSSLAVNFEATYPKYKKLEAAIQELHTYVRRNRNEIPDYGKDFRCGLTISTAFIESLVNSLLDKRFSKSQQMQWTPHGAHLLLQIRVRLANGKLPATFRRWYPGLPPDNDPEPKMAANLDEENAPRLRLALVA